MNPGTWGKEYFEKKYENEDPWNFRSSKYEMKKYSKQLDLIRSHYSEPQHILEIGCAEGFFTSMISNEYADSHITGIDFSKRSIERAKNQLLRENVEFIESDIIEHIRRFENNSIDIIFFSETIYYIGDTLLSDDFRIFLRNIEKTLVMDGILCMANIIELRGGDEDQITKRNCIEQYISEISKLLEPIYRSTFHDLKEECGIEHEYEICLFRKVHRKTP